jgi:adenosine deaminase
MTKAVHGDEEMKEILNTLYDNGVRFSINTDWPETIENAHLNRQVSYLLEHEMLTESQMQQTIEWGFDASFIPKKKGEDNLYL